MHNTNPSPWWHPDRLASRRVALTVRAAIQRGLRQWFDDLDFLEVETPALQVSPGLEPHLMAFRTQYRGVWPQDRHTVYLHTSPEFAMKKLLAGGLTRIFQFARVYRNGEATALHHPEFTLLEWYRRDADYTALIEDCIGLLRLACSAAGRDRLTWRDTACDPFGPCQRLTVAEAFARHTGIDLLATAPDPRRPDPVRLAGAARAAGIQPHDEDSWEDLFFRIMLERIEPALGHGVPTVLMEYPVSLACLARAKADDPRVAERFELYVCGVELANAFSELTDAVAQEARFIADMDLKHALYGERYPIDQDFLAALRFGLPESAGIALGFDRLVMLCTGAEHIEEVLWAPVALAETGTA